MLLVSLSFSSSVHSWDVMNFLLGRAGRHQAYINCRQRWHTLNVVFCFMDSTSLCGRHVYCIYIAILIFGLLVGFSVRKFMQLHLHAFLWFTHFDHLFLVCVFGWTVSIIEYSTYWKVEQLIKNRFMFTQQKSKILHYIYFNS